MNRQKLVTIITIVLLTGVFVSMIRNRNTQKSFSKSVQPASESTIPQAVFSEEQTKEDKGKNDDKILSYKILPVKKTEFVKTLENTEKNIFFERYENNCDKGEGDYISVFFCDTDDKLYFVSYTIKNPKSVDNPLPQAKLSEKLKLFAVMFQSSIVTNGWLSSAIKQVTDDNSIEAIYDGVLYTVHSTIGDYELQIDSTGDSKTDGLPSGKQIDYPKYYTFLSYEVLGKIRKNVRIKPDLNEEQIVELAREIHQNDPNGEYNIFSDDNQEEFEKYKRWEQNPDNPFTAWAEEKYVGLIKLMPDPYKDHKNWKLLFSGYWGSWREYPL